MGQVHHHGGNGGYIGLMGSDAGALPEHRIRTIGGASLDVSPSREVFHPNREVAPLPIPVPADAEPLPTNDHQFAGVGITGDRSAQILHFRHAGHVHTVALAGATGDRLPEAVFRDIGRALGVPQPAPKRRARRVRDAIPGAVMGTDVAAIDP